MRETSLCLLFFLVLTGCIKESPGKKGHQEILYTQRKGARIVIDYDDNKQIKRVTFTTIDPSQSAMIGFGKSGEIRYTGIEKNNQRTHTIEYYPNGRPIGLTNFDSSGTGEAVYYYDNGNKRSEGNWQHYFRVGVWKNYDKNGVLIKVDTLE